MELASKDKEVLLYSLLAVWRWDLDTSVQIKTLSSDQISRSRQAMTMEGIEA